MTPKRTHNFQVNLGGVLEVLSNHLYSSERVFIRELLQNACDAITARQLKQPDWKGEIHIELHADAERPLLVLEDNGIGLNESEVQQFLSSIGASAKRDYFANSRDEFIGQFGIGLLSCFMVSDEITLVTRAEGQPAIKWVGKVDGTYDLYTLEQDLSVGTKVYLTAKADKKSLFTQRSIQRLVRLYGEILPFPIFLRTNDDPEEQVNAQVAIWEQPAADRGSRRLEILDFGSKTFEMPFQDFIEIDLPEQGARGVAYILPYSSNPNSKQTHKVYLKRMLLSTSVDNIMPEWCFFVKCVLNVNGLRPTASRESFYEDARLDDLRDALGKEVRKYLFELAEQDPQKFSNILSIHELAFKQIALSDDDFFQMIVPFLRFSTTKGPMMLKEIKDNTIRHISNIDEFRKMAPIADARGMILINSGYIYDGALLRKLSESAFAKEVEHLDAKNFLEIFEDPDAAEKEAAETFIRVAGRVLAQYHCKPEVKKFNPSNLPMLYYMSDAVDRDRSLRNAIDSSNPLWNNILSNFAGDVTASNFSVLCFNLKNPVVQRLIRVENADLLSNVVQILYVNALLLGHHPVNPKEMNLLNTNILDLVDWVAKQ